MDMRRIYWVLALISAVMLQYSCSSDEKTYSEQKEQEREVVKSFIGRNVIIVQGKDT